MHDTNSSVIGSNAGDDKHEVECDDKFQNQRLEIGSTGKGSGEMVLPSIEY